MKTTALLFLSHLLAGSLALASSIASENSTSPTLTSSGLVLSLEVNKDAPDAHLRSVDVGYTYSTQLPDANAIAPGWIQTNALTGTFNFEYGQQKEWTGVGIVMGSSQPTENFTTGGVEFDLGRHIFFGEKKAKSKHEVESKSSDEEDGSFVPSITPGVKVGWTSLNQKTKVRVGRRLVTDLSEPQFKSGVDLSIDLFESISFYFEYNGYQYSPKINEFITYLNEVHPEGTNGMSTALGQLNIYDWMEKIKYFMSDDWDFSLSQQTSSVMTTGQLAYTYGLMIGWKVNKMFSLELGGSQTQPSNEYDTMLNVIWYPQFL